MEDFDENPDRIFGREVVSDNKKFRMCGTRYFFTYKTHIPKEEFVAWFRGRSSREVDVITLAHETADEDAPYEHTHVLVRFVLNEAGRSIDVKNPRYFDWPVGPKESIHPHIKIIENDAHWFNAIRYLGKEDPENADLREVQTPLTVGVWSKRDKAELYSSYIKSKKDLVLVPGLTAVFEAKPFTNRPEVDWLPKPDKPWQLEIIDLLLDPGYDIRHIYWYYDPHGNAGKSWVQKWLDYYHPVQVLGLTQCGGEYHMATLINTAFEGSKKRPPWNGNAVCFNFVRGKVDSDIYAPIEAVKDAMLNGVKYNGCFLNWRYPHVVVMANWPPKVDMLSQDRWVIRHVQEDGTVVPLSIADARKLCLADKDARQNSAVVDKLKPKLILKIRAPPPVNVSSSLETP